MEKEKDNYGSQLKLSILNLVGELPNFFALLFSAIGSGAVLVFIDFIDTAGNVLRNMLVVGISVRLRKDLKYQYNYGIGKIEAMSSMLCDSVMLISLVAMMAFAVKDLISPRPAEFLLFVLCVKVLNVAGDVFVYIRQRMICRSSDSLVLKSALGVAFKNLVFDLTSLVALVLMHVFSSVRAFWYISPVVSLVLGIYLLINTVRRLVESTNVMLDKSADEKTQMEILKTLTRFYEKYEILQNVRTRVSGGILTVDLELGFSEGMTYNEIKNIADEFATAISEKVPKCEVSLRITGEKQ